MLKYKFKNETFNFELIFVLYHYSKKKQCTTLEKYLVSSGLDKSNARECITNSRGFASSGVPYYIVIDIDAYTDEKTKYIDMVSTLQHECNHIRQFVLDSISEKTSTTDMEAHLRISDWAFKKCFSIPFFQKKHNK